MKYGKERLERADSGFCLGREVAEENFSGGENFGFCSGSTGFEPFLKKIKARKGRRSRGVYGKF